MKNLGKIDRQPFDIPSNRVLYCCGRKRERDWTCRHWTPAV